MLKDGSAKPRQVVWASGPWAVCTAMVEGHDYGSCASSQLLMVLGRPQPLSDPCVLTGAMD